MENDLSTKVLLNYFTVHQLEQIQSTIIGIAGLGGLGSNCAMNLVRSGFNKFILADFDRVEPSNLNRQTYFARHVGRLKVDCLAELMHEISDDLSIIPIAEKLDSQNIFQAFKTCSVVVEAFDRAEFKSTIVEQFISTEKLLISASGLAGFGNSDRIVTSRINDHFYLIGDGVSEVSGTLKPYAPCVAIAAAKQADAVLQWVLKDTR